MKFKSNAECSENCEKQETIASRMLAQQPSFPSATFFVVNRKKEQTPKSEDSHMSTAVTPPLDQAPPLSQMERIVDTFVAPSKTFADINRNANFLLAWLVMLVFSVAYSATVGAKVGWDHVYQTQQRFAPAAQQQRLESLPPDQRAQQERIGLAFTKGIAYGFQFIGLIFLAIVALILWATFSFGLGSEITFMKSWAIVVFASLPGIVKTVLATGVLLAGKMDPDLFMIQNPVGTNAGYFMAFDTTSRFIYSLATSFDLITIWVLVLTGIGFSIVGKVKQGTAMAVVFGWWGLVTLGGAALSAAFAK